MAQVDLDSSDDLIAGISKEIFDALVVYTARNVDLVTIVSASGLTVDECEAVRSTREFRDALSEAISGRSNLELGVDDQWDRVESLTVGHLVEQVTSFGSQMESGELLAIANSANRATRRHGGKNAAKHGGVNDELGVLSATVVNITLPNIVVQRLQEISESGVNQAKFDKFSNTGMDVTEVGKLLDVDVTKVHQAERKIDPEFSKIVDVAIHGDQDKPTPPVGVSRSTALVSDEAG